MRKSALILAVIMVAAPATALAAKAKAPADPNANGKKFVTAAFQQPVVLWTAAASPWWVAKKK